MAELECGHNQHVRHDPPWECRPWVVTPEGRRALSAWQLLVPTVTVPDPSLSASPAFWTRLVTIWRI